MTRKYRSIQTFLALTFFALGVFNSSTTVAATAGEIDINVDAALKHFYNKVGGARAFINASKGVLVFPTVLKAGIGIGGEYGEGALRIGGRTVDYYNTAAASIGLQLGAQAKTVVIVFLQDKALSDFRKSTGWKVGVDGSVALVEIGKGVSLDTVNFKDPVVGFIFNNKGLMFNVTLEGAKITKIKK
jgi:lipid-binding SYLF domain-containing protein